MKITYNKNPLYTTVELNEQEKKELWLKIKISEMEERISGANYYLEEGDSFSAEKARKELDYNYFESDSNDVKSQIDERCDMLLDYYVKELQSFHIGDCTCVACSCLKCHAEAFLGIDTMPGLKKHETYKINGAFGKDNTKTIDEAIESLSTFKIDLDKYQTEAWIKLGGVEQYIPQWTEETKRAHAWLVNYKKEHFSD